MLGIAPLTICRGRRRGQRHPAHKITSDDAICRTEQSVSSSEHRVRTGIAHGLRMVRLHIGAYYGSALIDDDDIR